MFVFSSNAFAQLDHASVKRNTKVELHTKIIVANISRVFTWDSVIAHVKRAQQSGSSTAHYAGNRRSLLVKRAYQRKYNKKKKEVKRRVALKRINRQKGTYGNGDGKDVSHKKDGTVFMEKASKNRARNRSRK